MAFVRSVILACLWLPRGVWAKGVEGHPLPLIRVVLGSGRGREELSWSNLSIWEMGGELVLPGRKWVSWLGNVLGGGDPLESLKRVLGFQVRSSGAPGPLTLKEVEELEQLTQQLMQDMEHPQRQNVAVSGEPTALLLGCLSPTSLLCWPLLWLHSLFKGSADSYLFIFFGLPRILWPVSPAPGTCTARSSSSGTAVPHHLLYLPPV